VVRAESGRDASKNLWCIHHLELAEPQSWRLDDNHCVSLSTTDNTSIDSWRKQATALINPGSVGIAILFPDVERIGMSEHLAKDEFRARISECRPLLPR
jgi:hypothetical protein